MSVNNGVQTVLPDTEADAEDCLSCAENHPNDTNPPATDAHCEDADPEKLQRSQTIPDDTQHLLHGHSDENRLPEETQHLLYGDSDEGGLPEAPQHLLHGVSDENRLQEEPQRLLHGDGSDNGLPKEPKYTLGRYSDENGLQEELQRLMHGDGSENGLPEEPQHLLHGDSDDNGLPEEPQRLMHGDGSENGLSEEPQYTLGRYSDENGLQEEPQRLLHVDNNENGLPGESQRLLHEDSDEEGLPEAPQRPLDSECCGSGCRPCVFDLYERDVAAWRRRCDRIRLCAAAAGRPPVPPSCPVRTDRYCALPLLSVTPLSADTALYRFGLPADAALRLPAGHHLTVRVTDARGRHVMRPYTPVSAPHARGHFDVYIRRYAGGAASACIGRWRAGDAVLWRGPFGEYASRPGDARLVLLAAGTGVAPMVALLRAALADDDDERRLTLLLAARSLRHVFPRRELREFARQWNFTYTLYIGGGAAEATHRVGAAAEVTHVDRSAADDAAWYGEPVRWRRLSRDDVVEVARAHALPTRYLVCGPRSFEKDMLNHLAAADVAETDVFRF